MPIRCNSPILVSPKTQDEGTLAPGPEWVFADGSKPHAVRGYGHQKWWLADQADLDTMNVHGGPGDANIFASTAPT